MIEQGAYILIAAGAFIFIISFLGYCGAIKESRVLLTAYGLFIVIIALLQIATIVMAAIYKHEAETHTKDFFQHTIRKYYTTRDRKDAVTLSWDFMMAEVRLWKRALTGTALTNGGITRKKAGSFLQPVNFVNVSWWLFERVFLKSRRGEKHGWNRDWNMIEFDILRQVASQRCVRKTLEMEGKLLHSG